MKKLLPSLFSLAVLTASAQPDALLTDATPAAAPAAAMAATTPQLELVSFEAYVAGTAEEVFLRWATASERDGERFILERSADMTEWSMVLETAGKGRASTYTPYEVQDADPLQGISYYRLRNIEQGTPMELSDLFSIRRRTGNELLIHAEPQPGHFSVHAAGGTLDDVQLLDNRGQFIPMALDVQDGGVLVNAELLAPGTYYVQATVDGNPVMRPVIITASGVFVG